MCEGAGPERNLCSTHLLQNLPSAPLLSLLVWAFMEDRSRGGATQEVAYQLSASYLPPSISWQGDSAVDLLITTQWSSNPADLIDSDCCVGLSARHNPQSFCSSSHAALICMTGGRGWGRKQRRVLREYTGLES